MSAAGIGGNSMANPHRNSAPIVVPGRRHSRVTHGDASSRRGGIPGVRGARGNMRSAAITRARRAWEEDQQPGLSRWRAAFMRAK